MSRHDNSHPLRTRLVHPGTLLALTFGLGACDVEDTTDLPQDDLDESADAADDESADAALTASPRPSALLPILTIAPPIHAEDLPKNHYLQINVDAQNGQFHDMIIARYDEAAGAWSSMRDDATGDERDALGWDIPIYSGVAGEVISCWRNAPYDMAFQPTLEQIGANFMIIRTVDDKYVFYAHMQTDAIPPELCPNESATGWYANVNQNRSGSNIPLESYVEPADRAQVSVGQYIGRMGAHGNAAGVHVHMHAGDVTTNGSGVVSVSSPAYELDFSDVWYHVADTQPPQSVAWTFAAPGDIPALAHTTKLRIWPSYKHEATFADPPHLGEFDQASGGTEDALCHSISSGGLWLDYGNISQLGGTDWSGSSVDFCSAPEQRLHKGDFDGDGLQDLLCHDIVGGERWVRYAASGGHFSGVPTFSDTGAWCNAEQQVLHVGDFDANGRDDLLCHNKLDGQRRIDLSAPLDAMSQHQMPFAGTNVARTNAWCNDHYQRLHIGDFDGDGRDDLLCHDVRDGKLWLDYSSGSNFFDTTDFSLTTANWCNQGGEHMLIGDFTADGRDDLLCHDGDDGDLEIRAAQLNSSRFLTTATWKRDDSGWCTGLRKRLRAGDIGTDIRDDLLCHDEKTGGRAADFMTAITGLTTGGFQGVDFTASGGWCSSNIQSLH